ncbi:hypothetical protein ON010_g2712 [Phytophthora cinnamomi]|nr:hypothetical protein ON010_g2712 [Phytophthora cinnamomi]
MMNSFSVAFRRPPSAEKKMKDTRNLSMITVHLPPKPLHLVDKDEPISDWQREKSEIKEQSSPKANKGQIRLWPYQPVHFILRDCTGLRESAILHPSPRSWLSGAGSGLTEDNLAAQKCLQPPGVRDRSWSSSTDPTPVDPIGKAGVVSEPRIERQVAKGKFATPPYENAESKNAKYDDVEALKPFFTGLMVKSCGSISAPEDEGGCPTVLLYNKGVPVAPVLLHVEYDAQLAKTNHALQFLVVLIHTDALQSAALLKGHTKNHYDRHFVYIKRHYAKRDKWVMNDVERVVRKSATGNHCINHEGSHHTFQEFKGTLEKRYRKVHSIQAYLITDMNTEEPGVVKCQKRPNSEPDLQALARQDVTKELSNLRDDPLYIIRDAEDQADIAATKRSLRQKTTQNKKRPVPKTVEPRKKRSAINDP